MSTSCRRFRIFLTVLTYGTLVGFVQGSIGTVRQWSALSTHRQWRNNGYYSLGLQSESSQYYDGIMAKNNKLSAPAFVSPPLRGGQDADSLVRIVGSVTDLLISCGRAVLPPTVAFLDMVIQFYRALPIDAVIAQAGLVYCFAGGYYPTLFSSLQAARHCGWEIMIQAVRDLTDEAIKVIHATANARMSSMKTREQMLAKTQIVLKTVDPVKINEAAGALYTTWLGVSSVLEKEYARVISLSLTMAGYIEGVTTFVIAPPAYKCISEDYHKWVPIVIGWVSKGVAMNIAWRIQRVLTAGTSAVAGGLMFSRACMRMLANNGYQFFGLIQPEPEASPVGDAIGVLVGGIGFYTQIESQFRSGFSFKVPYPLCLVTWPFDWAERWIQWEITK